jgi:hypothetical protein
MMSERKWSGTPMSYYSDVPYEKPCVATSLKGFDPGTSKILIRYLSLSHRNGTKCYETSKLNAPFFPCGLWALPFVKI